MRPFELILGILSILSAVILSVPSLSARLKKKWMVPAFLVLFAAAQLLLEGFRWQLWPLDLAVAVLIPLHLLEWESKWRHMLVGLSIFFSLVSITGGYLFPVPAPYPITGPFPVGTREIHLVDPNRAEIYGVDPEAPRELMAQIWYPAAPDKSNEHAGWMPGIQFAGPALAEMLDLPSFALNHLKYVKGNAFLEAPPLAGADPYPVLIFSHGWEGFKEQNIFQVEELASHGYVVVGINHTYGSVLTLFPDGRQVPINHEALPSGVSDQEYDQASDTLSLQWTEDIDLVLDELEELNQANGEWFLAGSLDLRRIGVFGHSTGGGAALRFCLTDVRCQAVLGMDVWAEPIQNVIGEHILRKPALFLYSENWDSLDHPDRNYGLMGQLAGKADNVVIELTLEGTKHYDFSSLPMLSPLTTTLGLKGPIAGDLVLEIINAESLAFFDRYLRGENGISLEGISQGYPEVQYGVRP